jgi:hypothetical protein
MILTRIKKFFSRILGFGEDDHDIIDFASSLVIENLTKTENFKPYRKQKKLLRHIQKNRFSICKSSRQSGKTLISIVYILYELFHCSDTSVVIIGHNYNSSLHILNRLREIFLRSRIFEDNYLTLVVDRKDRLQFSNGSTVEVLDSSKNAFKGKSYDISMIDEYAFFSEQQKHFIQNVIFPYVFSYNNTKLIISSSLASTHFDDDFNMLYHDAVKRRNQLAPFLIHWRDIPGRNRMWRKYMIKNIGLNAFNKEYNCIWR